MATTCSCRNWSKLLADYVAFTGSGAAGGGAEISKTVLYVGVGLCALYCVTVVMMLVFQRHPEQRWREVADVLEELTTTWYFGAALIVLWLLSRVLENNFLLAIAGLAILAGPAVVSLLAKDKKLHHLTSKHRVRR